MLTIDEAQHTVENLHATMAKPSHLIYIAVILLVVAIVASIPFIYVPVSIHARARIVPAVEKTSIFPLVTGRIKHALISDNSSVNRGDTLYRLQNDALVKKEAYLSSEAARLKSCLTDLQHLTAYFANPRTISISAFTTPYYRQHYSNYRQQQNELSIELGRANRAHERNLKLHSQQVIADAEFEASRFELDKIRQRIETVRETQLAAWHDDLRTKKMEYDQIRSQIQLLQEEKARCIITAPVKGSILQTAGIFAGSVVHPQMELAQISPDTSLVVEAFISPSDIGLITPHMQGQFQIDAFDYRLWGTAAGSVAEVGNDVHIMGDMPYFKVKCELATPYLQLGNGYRGYLRKGMTLQARFIVTTQSLWDLLFYSIDDWMNPLTYPNR